MSLNLHAVASEVISELNSPVTAQYYASTGNTENPDGTITPTYAAAQPLVTQIQELTQRDLRHAERLNLQGQLAGVWVNGALAGVIRGSQQGGDKIVINGVTWLVVAVPEGWSGPGWTHAIVQRQVGS